MLLRKLENPFFPGGQGTKISFFEKWSKPGSEGVVGTRGPPTVPTTPVFVRLLPFAQKLVRKSGGTLLHLEVTNPRNLKVGRSKENSGGGQRKREGK